ncbi:MAG TPA: dihydrofolate reductase [Steroidobacteraceae bacterium]
MTNPPVALVAMADNGVIGRDNRLPWHLPDDLRRFKSLTMGHAILMGRRTFESIGQALPGRRNLVLTRNPAWRASGCEVVAAPAAAIEAAGGSGLFVIGGAEVFSAFWPLVRRLELTEVHAEVEGDTRLAGFDRRQWREIFREEHAADERHAWSFSFVTLERR